MLESQEIKRAHDKMMRRQAIYETAVNEYVEVVRRALNQANTKIISRPLKVKEVAQLLELSRVQVYRLGANHCRTYADIHDWVVVNRKDLLKTLEDNYQEFLKEES